MFTLKKKKVMKTIADHNKAIKLNPNYAEAYINLGAAYEPKENMTKPLLITIGQLS